MNGEAQATLRKEAALQKQVVTTWSGERPHINKPGRTSKQRRGCASAEKTAMDAQHPTDPNTPNTLAAPASVTGIAGVTNSLGGITGQTEEDMMLTPPVPGPEKQATFLGETLIRSCLRNSLK